MAAHKSLDLLLAAIRHAADRGDAEALADLIRRLTPEEYAALLAGVAITKAQMAARTGVYASARPHGRG